MVCKNCKRLLPQQINFCNGCGAKVIKNRLTIRNLFEDFAYRYLNYDNQFLRTFLHLFTKPELVIDSYIGGTRKKYVNVISYFAIAITLSGFQIFIQQKFFPELMDMSAFAQKGQEVFMSNYMAKVIEFQSLIFVLTVPFYALISKSVFLDIKKYNFTEHLVINMYISAHFSIIGTLAVLFSLFVGVNFSAVGMAIIFLQIIYAAYCFKRLFNLNKVQILLRTLLFSVIITVVFVIITILGVALAFAFGGFDEMIEAAKAGKKVKVL